MIGSILTEIINVGLDMWLHKGLDLVNETTERRKIPYSFKILSLSYLAVTQKELPNPNEE